ncbi:carbohydrate esterase family 1 protein [Xylaria palmicola]|nr:carbohydrate esterase family 1 protein [Xylaria palmicola]
MSFRVDARIATFGGELLKLSHDSTSTKTPMNVSVYLPPASRGGGAPVPVLLYLSGLTCTPNNCSEKGFLHAAASRRGIAVVYPDTSPRGAGIAGEDKRDDLGTGAGFYVDATQAPWGENYRMETYVVRELLDLLFADEGPETGLGAKLDRGRVSITGHSMGGHGALTLYLKHPGLFRSVSAFAPICNPTKCPWGENAFENYLGKSPEDKEAWKRHDATELVRAVKKGTDLRALIDVGTGDQFFKSGQLLPENFDEAVKDTEVTGVTVRYQENYDHSYYFISTFAEDHVEHAAKYLF